MILYLHSIVSAAPKIITGNNFLKVLSVLIALNVFKM
jgi:hypothetical protein